MSSDRALYMHREEEKDSKYSRQPVTKMDLKGGWVRGAHSRKCMRKDIKMRNSMMWGGASSIR